MTAREAALDILDTLTLPNGKLGMEELLNSPAMQALEVRERAFARLLIMTVLRHQGQIDAVISAFMPKPLPLKYHLVSHLLRLGVAQLLWLDTPPHAAVNEMVALAKAKKMIAHSGLINAVLKKVAREGQNVRAEQDVARLSLPDWLWNRWVEIYGEERTRDIVLAQLIEPALDISVKSDAAVWAKRLRSELLPTGSIRRHDAGRIDQLPGFAEGIWWVQDAAAALPARLLGNVKGKYVVDLCAAPGGKTAQLAAGGAQVVAVDRAAHRMSLLHENMKRLKLSVEAVVADAGAWKPLQPPDAILLDAPCSATGTMRRHPEIAWLKNASHIAELQPLQWQMLNHACDILPSGALLVYCVCSLEPEEGEQQITRLLQERTDMELVPVLPEEVGGLAEMITPRGELRCLPCHMQSLGGMDGFFAARLVKK